MQTFTLKRFAFLFYLVLGCTAVFSQSYSNIEFVENKGQWDSRVKFKGDVSYGSFFLRSGGFTVLQHNREDMDRITRLIGQHDHPKEGQPARSTVSSDEKIILRSHSYNVDFIGANPSMTIVPDKPISTYNNYFLGNDPQKWAGGCRIYQAVEIKEVYPNIDVRYYTDNGMLKYDIIVKPGGDIKKIALKYEGADRLDIDKKELVVRTSIGDFRESYPYTYQVSKEGKKEVSARYMLKDNIVRFDIKGYDPKSTLVIDPFLIFCSLSGSDATNWGFTATYGPDGSFFGGGIVFNPGGGRGFPVSPGAFQTVWQGGTGGSDAIDIGIIKLTPNGSSRVYATYLGGSGNEQPHSLIVNGNGELIVAGRSSSSNYPITTPLIGRGGGFDIIVTKLNADGTGLLGSARIGGTGDDGVNIRASRSGPISLQRNYGDDGRSEVMLDGAGNIYVASSTLSTGSSNPADNFPATPAAFQPTPLGAQDAVVLKFTPSVTLSFASYLGGSRNDAGYVVSLDPAGNIYVAGGTESSDFEGITAGTVGATKPGDIDGYVAVISNDGSTLQRATYIGTSGVDQVYGLKFDQKGFPYVMGTSTGSFPVTPGVYNNPGSKQFIAKLQPDLSTYVYSTVFGSASTLPNISPTAFLVDRCENVYVSGWGGNIGYQNLAGTNNSMPVKDPVNPPGRSGATTDGGDFYIIVLKRDAADILYGGFYGQLGGDFTDHVDGGTSRFDENGIIYQAMCAACGQNVPSFPTTSGAWATVRPANAFCNLGMLKIQLDLAGVGSNVGASIDGVPNDTAGCLPLTVVFTDRVLNAQEYIWNFGDDGNGPVDSSDPIYSSLNEGPFPASPNGYTRAHTFQRVGTYRVMMIAIDPNSCNIRDTSYINIRVGDLKANLDAHVEKLAPCEALNYRFTNLSTTDISRPFTDTSFIWDFGDGSPRIKAGLNPVEHAYPAPGQYFARLVLNDTAYCNNPDSLRIPVNVSANVKASFTTPPSGCSPYTAVFINTSTGNPTFEWDFGDPASGADNTSTLINPTHTYLNPGTYTVVMVANDPNTCNRTDTARFTIVINEKPQAAFTYAPVVPQVNTPVTFSNQSSANAIRFKWNFGDGDTLLTTSRANVQHQYNATGRFNVCLVVFTTSGCTDTICQPVDAIVVPELDVPNAFTPNSGDINSVVMPRGFGIAKLHFTIWNRWGQKVFETNSRNQGWDGRVRGVVQPMDVYAYTLEVEFFDGTKATKKGDITLIR